MGKSRPNRPERAEVIRDYETFQRFLLAFGNTPMSSLLIVGNPGLQKSRLVADVLGERARFIRGQSTAYALYAELHAHRNKPIVLDDLDHLFADRTAIRLLKCLLETEPVKRLAWRSRAPLGDGMETEFTTTSRVILITNAWETINKHVEAVEDRAHVLVFEPGALEVHLQVAGWFWDQEIFEFIGEHLGLIARPSMREYRLAWERKRSGLPWRDYLLGRWLTGKQRLVAQLITDPTFPSEEDRARAFRERGGGNRATYFNVKRSLPHRAEAPRIELANRPPDDPAEPRPDLLELLCRRHGQLGKG
jgi:hypothetical protein